jgi:hypothetical protein
MTPKLAHSFLLPACKQLFPNELLDDKAQAMMLAIGMQESDFLHRQQLIGNHRNWWESVRGPATSFWQFEKTGVAAVLGHHRARPMFDVALRALGYPADVNTIHKAITHNDILAVAIARCLLFTFPDSLPDSNNPEEAWQQYLWCWRPGKPKENRWNSRYNAAWDIVSGVNDNHLSPEIGE